ncbi:MAG TPA: hypothetical protein VJV23_12060 [Candidatus Polarisedimenticolia bacterium]|nr:hypothetical protein [Candidatus Polarisedimenticolia bacterium]
MRPALWPILAGPRSAFHDLLAAIEGVLPPDLPAFKLLLPPVLGLLAGWYAYVPVHELLHAAGCVLAGGTVTELRIDPVYGGRILAAWLPFVSPAQSGYAGRLTGFDTGGSDVVYLATDLFPFTLTVLAGVPLLREASRGALRWWGWRRCLFGPAVVMATAPFISATGDYFEMGSILVTAPLPEAYRALRSDDLFRLIEQLDEGTVAVPEGRLASGGVATLSLVLGVCLAGWTYLLGGAWASFIARLRERAASAPPSPSS